MKKSLLVLFTAIIFTACNKHNDTEKTLAVFGNCEQCKARIEKAGKIDGVSEINWNVDSKLLTVKLDTTVTGTDAILKAIAAVGHDNELYHGNDYAYQNLPACCHYERQE